MLIRSSLTLYRIEQRFWEASGEMGVIETQLRWWGILFLRWLYRLGRPCTHREHPQNAPFRMRADKIPYEARKD